MNDEIRQALADEILRQLNGLSGLEAGSDEEQTAVENVTKLYKLGLEEAGLDKQTHEEGFKRDQLSEQTKDRYFRLGIEVAGIVLPLIFYASWMKKGFKFEETGVYTSTTFKGLFNRFRPTKK